MIWQVTGIGGQQRAAVSYQMSGFSKSIRAVELMAVEQNPVVVVGVVVIVFIR